MDEYIFGANILENLTTGMYKDSKVIYREYIQNACDQIDKAIAGGILEPNKGKIDIWLDETSRTITIEDNATGIKSTEFQRILGNIADSDKRVGEDKGFRGIGRLCGLAYCKELIFSSTYMGEGIISTMRCDAQKMRELILENELGNKITASDILHSIFHFSQESDESKTEEHWFKVEMIGINNENTELLDTSKIINYLSFIAPVPYQNTFIYRSEIYDYAKKHGFKIDEYKICCNGEQIFKQYSADFNTSKGKDSFHEVAFDQFKDENNNLLAWMWIGVSTFKGVIKKANEKENEPEIRGLRLRKENIQIGTDEALQPLFAEDRGNHYYIGEVFAVSKDLIPNSQRDYFNENATRLKFEEKLREHFGNLKKIYYAASEVNSSFSKIKQYKKELESFEQKQKNGDYVNEEHQANEGEKLKEMQKKAEEGRKKIEKAKEKATKENNETILNVISHIEQELSQEEQTPAQLPEPEVSNKPIKRATDSLSAYSKKERKLIEKIFDIILKSTDTQSAETIIEKIKDGLK